MKRIIYGESSWLIGDEAAETVMRYAVELAKRDAAASVDLSVVDGAGATQTVSFLIGPATMMMAETTRSSFPEPDNAAVVDDIRVRIDRMVSPPNAVATGERPLVEYFDDL